MDRAEGAPGAVRAYGRGVGGVDVGRGDAGGGGDGGAVAVAWGDGSGDEATPTLPRPVAAPPETVPDPPPAGWPSVVDLGTGDGDAGVGTFAPQPAARSPSVAASTTNRVAIGPRGARPGSRCGAVIGSFVVLRGAGSVVRVSQPGRIRASATTARPAVQ